MRKELLGRWYGKVEGEAVALEFLDDGRLAYAIRTESSTQIIRMTYRTEGDILITDQPSHPQEERTRFNIEPDGTLVLEFQGQQSRFTR
jgi:hypothetical protein